MSDPQDRAAPNGASDPDAVSAFDAYAQPWADAADAGAGAGDPPHEDAAATVEAYTPDELAALLAALSAYGVPVENLDAYQRAILARTRPALELLDVGDALLAYGVGKGGPGLSNLPPWARLLAGVAVVGVTVVMTRKEHGAGELLASDSSPSGPAAGAESARADGSN